MKHYLIAVGLIVLAVVLVHGRTVGFGLLLDDYNHRAELREGSWSFRSLVDAAHLGGERRRVRMWWQDEADQFFFRPVAFLLMRTEYVVGGWQPAVMHGFSLAWTVAGAVLVMALAQQVLNLRWACLAGVLFAIHPGNYLTIGWIACQNEQMVAVFILAGLTLYANYSGWCWQSSVQVRRGGYGFLIGALLCFIAALGCRENSIIFIPLIFMGDFLLRPQRTRRRWGIYVFLALLLIAYFVIRHVMLGGFSMPGYPYAYPIGEPGFLRVIVDKFIYYVLGLFAYFPIIGFSGLRELRGHPFLFYGIFSAIVLLWGALLWCFRQRRGLFFWIILTLLPLGPVLPIFASSHHLYLASAGMIIASVIAAKWIIDWAEARRTNTGKVIQCLTVSLVIIHMIGFIGATSIFHTALAGFSAACQMPVKEVVQLGRDLKSGDKLFFINLPMLGFNCIPGIEEASGISPLEGHLLTFAPGLTVMDDESYVERVGTNQLRVRLEGDGYFSGITGQSILKAIGRDRPFEVGEQFSADGFDVQIVRSDKKGVRELLFTFDRPLSDPAYHFFFGSPRFSAYPLEFD